MRKNLQLRAKTKANLKPELKMKVVWNTSNKEIGGETNSAHENCSKISFQNIQKSLLLF